MDVGCYCVSGTRLLAAASRSAVTAEQVIGGNGVDVALAATLRFPGDVLAHVRLRPRHGAPPRARGRSARTARCTSPTRGTAASPGIRLTRGEDAEAIEVAAANPYSHELENFARAARGERAAAVRRARRARRRRGRSRRSTRRPESGHSGRSRCERRDRARRRHQRRQGARGVRGRRDRRPRRGRLRPVDAAAGLGRAGSRGLVARHAAGARGAGRRRRRGIGLSGQMHGLVALDAAEQVLRPAILWNDQRTAAQCAEIEERIGLAALIAATGNRALTGFTAPKLLWMRAHEPDVYARIAHDRCCRRTTCACGSAASTRSTSRTPRARCCSTSRTGAGATRCATRSRSTRRWLPRALESPEVSGETSDGIPVAAGAGDQAAGALGVGVEAGPAVGRARHLRRRVLARCPSSRPTRRRACTRSATRCRARWHAMGVMLSAAGSLRWLRDTSAPGVEFGALVAEAARRGSRAPRG